jgi:hypothetical protein
MFTGLAQVPTKADILFNIFNNNVFSKCINVTFNTSAKLRKAVSSLSSYPLAAWYSTTRISLAGYP